MATYGFYHFHIGRKRLRGLLCFNGRFSVTPANLVVCSLHRLLRKLPVCKNRPQVNCIKPILDPAMSQRGHRYFVLNKPQNVVSQFTGNETVAMLGTLGFEFPEGTHAIGRLDSMSEGLLLLTTNTKITRLLFQGHSPHRRTYLVRVKNKVDEETLHRLRTGITIRIKDGEYYTTPPCEVNIVENPKNLFPHQLEQREYVAHTWLQVSLYEGKYHQVRKMVFAAGHRCQRLIRTSIEDMELGTLAPGAVREMEEKEFFELLKLGGEGSARRSQSPIA